MIKLEAKNLLGKTTDKSNQQRLEKAALMMLKKGKELNYIQEITNLSLEKILKLRNIL